MEVALAMLVAGLPAVAVAGEKVDKKLNVDPHAEVEIDIVRGKVQVEGWDQPVVHVEGTLDDKTEAFIFESSGKRVQSFDTRVAPEEQKLVSAIEKLLEEKQ